MSQTLLLAAGLAGAYYLYQSQTNKEELNPVSSPTMKETPTIEPPILDAGSVPIDDGSVPSDTYEPQCDEGYVYNSSTDTCDATLEFLNAACGKNYKYDPLTESCVMDGRLGCPEPFVRKDAPTEEDPNGFECVDPTQYVRDDSGDIFKTGNAQGDIAVSVFANIGAGLAVDMGLDSATKYVSENLLTSQADRAAKELAEKAAKEAAEKAAAEAAEKAAKELAEKVAKEAAEKAATEAAQAAAEKAAVIASKKAALIGAKTAKSATIAAKAGKSAMMLTKIKGTPFSFIITIIATILASVLDVDPENFEACKEGEFDYSTLPDWAKALIEAVPFVGDLLMLLGPVMCMGKGCDPPLIEENGLCYEPCLPGWWGEAFLCYAQDDAAVIDKPGFTANGELHTTTHMTKHIESDLGKPRLEVGVCPDGSKKDSAGALCYTDVPENYNIVWGVAYENCAADERDDGAFCAKETINPCGEGEWEVGRDCWGNRTDYIIDCFNFPASGGECRAWGVEHCSWSPGTCTSWGRDECTSFGLLGTSCIWNAAACNSWGQDICTTNYAECADWAPIVGCGSSPVQMPELRRTFADRGWSFSSRAKNTIALAGRERELDCPPGTSKQAGWNETCYDDSAWATKSPTPYQMQSAGLISQICPSVLPDNAARGKQEFNNFEDIGVSCARARYNRGAGKAAIKMYIKKKKETPVVAPPPYCKDVANVISDPNNLLLCIDVGCGEDASPNEDYSLCVPKCKPLYVDEGEYCTRPAGITDPLTGQVYELEDTYKKPENYEMQWGVY